MEMWRFEQQMTRIIPSFAGFTEFTTSIPKMYWDVKSQEQRILGLCKLLNKVICYADMLGENVDEIAKALQDIEDGKLDPMIEAAIAAWFDENEPEIMEDIGQLQLDVTDIIAEIGTGFDSDNTIASNIAAHETELTRLSLIASVRPYYGYNMVSIGDSFMSGTGASEEAARLPNRISHRLGMNLFNYAVGGAGFWDEHGENAAFPHQIENAIANMTSSEINNTKLVLIYGGYNDYQEYLASQVSRATWLIAVQDTVNAARNAFPNANIFVAPMNWACYEFDNVARVWYYDALETLRKMYVRNLHIIENAPFWNLGLLSNYSGGSNVHPNDKGYRETASRMLRAIEASNINDSRSQSVPYSAVTFGNRLIEDINGTVYFNLGTLTASGLEEDSVVLTLPDRYIPQFQFAVPVLWNFDCIGILRFRTDGLVTFNKNSTVSYPLTGTGYVSPITYPMYARKVQEDN